MIAQCLVCGLLAWTCRFEKRRHCRMCFGCLSELAARFGLSRRTAGKVLREMRKEVRERG